MFVKPLGLKAVYGARLVYERGQQALGASNLSRPCWKEKLDGQASP